MAEQVDLDQGLVGERIPLEAVPVIDFEPFRLGGFDARVGVGKRIGDACRNIGFFYVRNHGVPDALVARTFAEAKRFFDLPAERKHEIAIENSSCHRGFFALGGENLDPAKQREQGDFKEGVKIGRDLPEDHPLVAAGTPLHGANQWPSSLPGWQGAIKAYYESMDHLGRQIMRAFALALDIDECFFDPKVTEPMTTLGPLHYPPQRGRITEQRIGAGAHTDFGCVTMLAQDDAGGLQVRNAAGRWIDAPPIPGTFVINVGDMMARWTNDHFASTTHRVINISGMERYSMPFFFDPNFDAEVRAQSTCTGPDDPAKYPPTTGGQHLLDKINETFTYHREKDVGGS
ncbi:MAG: isopenicillin N synthase family oxygenase [Alphaproteobacteria bacterium]|nr:isopenicillin N synthase family oxygenase [Alphaproteobacteria bacterium]